MARQAVIPGRSIEAVTPREIRDLLRRELRDAPGRNITASADATLDASTRAIVPVYTVPDGMEFELGWVLIEVSGATWNAPVIRTNCSGAVFVNDALRDALYSFQDPAAPGQMELVLPFRKDYSSGGTVRIRNGSQLAVGLQWNAAGVVVATIGGRLYSVPPTERSNS